MEKTWILVADSSRARIFTAKTPTSPLNEIQTLTHPEGRLHARDLTTDLPGREAGNPDHSHHGLSIRTDPKKQEAIIFARHISQQLDEARKNHSFDQLIIIAEPAFLGLLREHMSSTTAKLITLELNKNLSKQNPDIIRQHLPDILPRAKQ